MSRPTTAFKELEEASQLIVMATLCFERALLKLGNTRDVDHARRHAVTQMYRDAAELVDFINALAGRMRGELPSDVGAVE